MRQLKPNDLHHSNGCILNSGRSSSSFCSVSLSSCCFSFTCGAVIATVAFGCLCIGSTKSSTFVGTGTDSLPKIFGAGIAFGLRMFTAGRFTIDDDDDDDDDDDEAFQLAFTPLAPVRLTPVVEEE